MGIQEAIDLIHDELKKAEIKHPGWPNDMIHAAAILGEEAGELLQASIDYEYDPKKLSEVYNYNHMCNMKKEAAQTGAMAIRFLMNL